MTINWEKQEPGWYTSPLGGICDDGTGKWFFWPRNGKPDDPGVGPWKSLKEAKEAASKVTNGHRRGEA